MNLGHRICTVTFGSLPFTAAWEFAIHATADTAPPAWMVLAGVAPQVIAGVMVAALIVEEYGGASDPATVPTQRRAPAPAQRELAR